MDGEVKRGEVWWVKYGDSVGSEEFARRPMAVVSSDVGNTSSSLLLCAGVTSSRKYGRINVEVHIGTFPSWVMCNQIQTIDKTRLVSKMGELSADEMADVDAGLRICMDLGSGNTSEVEKLQREIESLNTELRECKAQIAGFDDKRAEDLVERDVYKRLYEKAIDEIVKLRLEVALKEETLVVSAEPTAVVEKKKDDVVEVPIVVEEDSRVEDTVTEEPVVEETVERRLNINTATAHEIASAIGCNISYGYNVTGYRKKNGNFVSIEEIDDVPYMTSGILAKLKSIAYIEEFGEVEDPIVDEPIADEPMVEETGEEDTIDTRLNVNTASTRELMAVGFPKDAAGRISNIRKKFGDFKSVEDLLRVDGVSTKLLREVKDKLFVE